MDDAGTIRVICQFLIEHGYQETFEALQRERFVKCN